MTPPAYADDEEDGENDEDEDEDEDEGEVSDDEPMVPLSLPLVRPAIARSPAELDSGRADFAAKEAYAAAVGDEDEDEEEDEREESASVGTMGRGWCWSC